MHYLIDGYNLLFKENWALSLQNAREKLISELDRIATILTLDCTIVFDAHFQTDDLHRGHYNSLEIVFTAHGQTADEYIASYVEHQKKKIVIITSDRGLQAKVKAFGKDIETVKHFLTRLRKRCYNKLAKTSPPKKKEKPLPAKKPPGKIKVDMKNLPPLSDLDTWEKIFTQDDIVP